MATLLLVAGLLLAGQSALALSLGIRSIFGLRSRLRTAADARMPLLKGEIVFVLGWSMAFMLGSLLMWFSQRP